MVPLQHLAGGLLARGVVEAEGLLLAALRGLRTPHPRHNALAALTYVIVFLVALVMAFTGFAMRGQINRAVFWTRSSAGSSRCSAREQRAVPARLGMWVLIAFMIHHITFVFYWRCCGKKACCRR